MKRYGSLPVRNIQRRPGRSAALILLSLLLGAAVLGGTLVIAGLRSGLASLEARLGADIMVVPYEAATKSGLSDMVLQGNPGYFYMDIGVAEKIAAMDGAGQVSGQFYLASASSSCCSVAVQLIGFDPDTDFTIRPWVQNTYRSELKDGEILVGNDLNAFPGDTLTFYGTDCQVAAKLDRTGTYLDTAVYASNATIKELIAAAKEKQLFNFGDVDPDAIVSCVLVNVADGFAVEDVLNDINIHVRKVKAVRSKNLISSVTDQLTGISDMIAGLILVVWLLALAIMALAFTMISNERKKEFAVLRALGASRGKLIRVLLQESVIVSLLGSAAGAVLAVLITAGVGRLIESSLGLPFLLPGFGGMLLLAAGAILISTLAGALASSLSAWRISRMDTALILRGENG